MSETTTVESPSEPTIAITYEQLEKALYANMVYKTGGQPIEGQVKDLWRRLGGQD